MSRQLADLDKRADGRALSLTEEASFRQLHGELRALEQAIETKKKAQRTVKVVREPRVYERFGTNSFFRDVALAAVKRDMSAVAPA